MLLLPLLFGALALLYSRNQLVVYEARVSLIVNSGSGRLDLNGNDFVVGGRLASTYARLVTTTPFLQQVVERNSLSQSPNELKGMLSASTLTDPPIVELRVRNQNPEVAAEAAQLVATGFIDYVVEQRLAEIARMQSAATAQGIVNLRDLVGAQLFAVNSLSLLEPVSIPRAPVLPRTRQNVMLGVIVGLVLAAGIALLLESMGDTVRNPEDVTRRFGVTALGSVFRWSSQDANEQQLVLLENPKSNFAESFRQIRANMQFAMAGREGNLFLFCSPGPGEGKSTVTCNMAIALASSGKKVVVIDGDLRRATVHKRFKAVNREPGLSNYLADFTSDVDAIVQRSEAKDVSVISSGPTPPNPAELLGSPKMNTLLERLKAEYDYVLIDSAPVLLVADGSILASQANGAVVIVDSNHTRSSSLQATLDTLRNTHVEILGVVINKMKRSRFSYGYGYGYYSGYTYYGAVDGDERLTWSGKLLQLPAYLAKSAVLRYRSRKA
jgi:capsular exopolysaccharide synthesis family protein